MAAPTPSTRIAPGGIRLPDGYQCLFTIAADTDISLWEISGKPPGIDGGEPVDTFTQHNTVWRTMGPRQLKTLTPSTYKVAYDPAVLTQLVSVINVNTTITQSFFDGTTWAYYGFVQKFEPDEMVEGTMPTGTLTLVPTNYDPVNRVEAGPVITSVAGS